MKRSKQFHPGIVAFVLFCISLLMHSCADDTFQSGGNGFSVAAGQMQIDLTLPPANWVQTRVQDLAVENTIDIENTWMLLFTANGFDECVKLKYKASIEADASGAYEGGASFTTPKISEAISRVVILTNIPDIGGLFPAGTTEEDVLKKLLQEHDLTGDIPATGWPHYKNIPERIPMYIAIDKVDLDLTKIEAKLQRLMAKISIHASAVGEGNTQGVPSFKIASVQVCDAAVNAFAVPINGEVERASFNYSTYVVGTDAGKLTAVDNSILSQLFVYPKIVPSEPTAENPPLSLVVGGYYNGSDKVSYHRLVISYKGADENAKTSYNIERNYHYTINVSRVDGEGYASAQEAALAPPSNVVYNIVVDSHNAFDILGNAQLSLALTNSEYRLYGTPIADSEYIVANLTTRIHSGEVVLETKTSAGITLVDPDKLNRPTHTPADMFNSEPIRVRIAPGTTRGTLTIRLGNLIKEIPISVHPGVSTAETEITDFAKAPYMSAERTGGAVRFSSSAASYFTASPAATHTNHAATGIYAYVRAASLLSQLHTFYLGKGETTNAGAMRLKVQVEQKGLPATFSSLKNMYVGAFWKNSELGERLIQQQGTTLYNGTWTAEVLAGAEWIELDGDAGKVPANGALPSNPAPNERLATNLSEITSTGNIKFRIGLKSTLPAGANPRYGVVMITYTQNNVIKYHPIYIRQGEEADALIPGAEKWSAYNMEEMGVSTVDFPSKAGRFTQFNSSTVSYSPLQFSFINGGSTTEPIGNKCPPGYKVPTHNMTGATETLYSSIENQAGTLYHGQNKHWGYYADGYFDRYTVHDIPITAMFSISRCAVNSNSDQVAYSGYLVANPSTLASLFLPATGAAHPTSTVTIFQGNAIHLHFSNAARNNSYTFRVKENDFRPVIEGYGVNSYKTYGFNIRCIKDEGGFPYTIMDRGQVIHQEKMTETAKRYLPSAPIDAPASMVFAGWNTKADGTGTNYNANAQISIANGTNNLLYAKWNSVYAENLPAYPGFIGIDSEGRLRLDLTPDVKDGMMVHFRWGGVVGLAALDKEAVAVNVDAQVRFNPSLMSPFKAYADIPYNKGVTATENGFEHTLANLRVGQGDPCRLVGYTQAEVRAEVAAGRLPDNHQWRMPTESETLEFCKKRSTFQTANDNGTEKRWNRTGYYIGGTNYQDPNAIFWPTTTYINEASANKKEENVGFMHTSTRTSSVRYYRFNASGIIGGVDIDNVHSFPVRCVKKNHAIIYDKNDATAGEAPASNKDSTPLSEDMGN